MANNILAAHAMITQDQYHQPDQNGYSVSPEYAASLRVPMRSDISESEMRRQLAELRPWMNHN